MRNLLLLIGTRKGAFIARTDRERRHWELRGPFFAGAEVNDVNLIPGDPRRIVVAGKSIAIETSDDGIASIEESRLRQVQERWQ